MIVALYSHTCESGKDTCADFIQDWAQMENRTCTRAAFADEMKIVCADALGHYGPREHQIRFIDEIKLHGYIRSYFKGMGKLDSLTTPLGQTHADGRDFIIGLAESIRRLDPEFWIRHTAASEAEIHVITDCRFRPEVDWVRANGGVVVEIIRPGTKHVNEDTIDPEFIDHIVVNDGDFDQLGVKVFHTMDLLFPI